MIRQESLKLVIPREVAVVGCGGVGTWVAYFLALTGVKELWLFDGDVVSDHNLNRIPLPADSVDMRKAEAVKKLIESVRPECQVYAMGLFSKEVADACDLGSEIDWIVVTTDTLHSRQMVKKWTEHNMVSYIEAAAEGEMGSVTGQPAEWKTPEEDHPGYASVPVWLGPCVFSAAIAVAHIVHDFSIGDRTIRIGCGQYEFEMFDSKDVRNGKAQEV